MDWLPISRAVKVWFDQYGATLDDAQSFRIQRRSVLVDVMDLARHRDALREAGDQETADEMDASLRQGRELLAALDARLEEILKDGPRRKRSQSA